MFLFKGCCLSSGLCCWELSVEGRNTSCASKVLSILNSFCLNFQPTAFETQAAQKVDDLLESYMGIRDEELGK